jgi:CRP/FNR family transcriptional regulator
MATKNLIKLVEHIPLFKNFTKNDRKKICEMCKLINFKEGEVIFNEGEKDDSLYIILNGKVKILKSRTDRNILLAELDKGDFFGEMEILHPSKSGRTASAVASSDTELVKITKEEIDKAIKNSRLYAFKLIHFFAKVLCERLRRMDDAYTQLFLEQKGENKIDELKHFREKLIKDWGF